MNELSFFSTEDTYIAEQRTVWVRQPKDTAHLIRDEAPDIIEWVIQSGSSLLLEFLQVLSVSFILVTFLTSVSALLLLDIALCHLFFDFEFAVVVFDLHWFNVYAFLACRLPC